MGSTCVQCGHYNKQDKDGKEKEFCCECGAALIAKSFWDINGDGKVDIEDLKTALNNAAQTVRRVFGDAKNIFRSQAEKDRATIEKLIEESSKYKYDPTNKKESFIGVLQNTIDLKIAECLAKKSSDSKYLEFYDAQIITTSVHSVFYNILKFTPRQVSAACALSRAILAPSAKEKESLFKAAVGFAGGTAGIGMVISSVGSALGWGSGVIASITAAFVGTSFAGPIAWGVGGLSFAAIAGYFAKTSNKESDSERFINVLKLSTEKSVEAIWDECGEQLSEYVDNIHATAVAN